MKKRIAAILSSALILSALAGCAKETAHSEENGAAASLTAPTASASGRSSADELVFEEEKTSLPENFSPADYIDSFDDAEPISYSVDTSLFTYEYEISPGAQQAALDAVNASKYLAAINAEAQEMLEYKDNVYTCPEEKRTFLADTYLEYMGEDFKVKPRLLQTRSSCFDGKNREYIFTYIVPLHDDFLEWSGTCEFVIPVYVNSSNEAYILDAAAHQTSELPELLHYSDGVVHAAFVWGHTSGTTGSAIYSFSGGKPTLEFSGGGLKTDKNGTVLFNDVSGFLGYGNLFFRDGIRNCYCGIAGAPVPEELADILRDHADIPDFDEVRDSLAIYGGKYIAFSNGTIIFENDGFCNSGYVSVFQTDGDYKYWVNVNLYP